MLELWKEISTMALPVWRNSACGSKPNCRIDKPTTDTNNVNEQIHVFGNDEYFLVHDVLHLSFPTLTFAIS
jgi:hypothetical protein